MGRELRLHWFGKARSDPTESLCELYRRRIEHYVPVIDQPHRPEVKREGAERLDAEAQVLRGAAPDPCRWIVLDRRGRQLSSREFARLLATWREEWPHPIAFAIGSDLGVDSSFAAEAGLRWSLGPLTLPHSVARLVVYEQIYRGLSLGAGIKYHRDPL